MASSAMDPYTMHAEVTAIAQANDEALQARREAQAREDRQMATTTRDTP